MARRNVIVRKLPSVETLGCTSVICTDKTGTLTTNEMTAVSLVMFGTQNGEDVIEEFPVTGSSYNPEGIIEGPLAIDTEFEMNGSLKDVAAVCALCNDAKIVGNDHGDGATEKIYERFGEPTEAALCVLAEKIGGVADTLSNGASNQPPSVLASAHTESWRASRPRTATLEFNRNRKSMSVLCRKNVESSHNQLLVKGAPNLLLQRCTHIKLRNGETVPLNGSMRRMIEEKTSELAQRPLRCLALAVKDTDMLESSLQYYDPELDGESSKHPLLKDSANYAGIESGLTLVGIIGIKDPARPEVAGSIQKCREAGIRIMMITGDARDTAVAIAKEVNIFEKHETELKVS